MTDPTPAEQLLNLANRAEKGLTGPEADRLREGIRALHGQLITARAVAQSNRRHVRAIVPDLETAVHRIERVRRLATATRDATAAGRNDWQIGQHDLAITILAALDEQQEQQPT